MFNNEAWRADATCRNERVDPELFYPVGRSPSPGYQEQEREALAVCARCPVRAECLEAELAIDVRRGSWNVHGVRGGMGEEDRKALVKRLRVEAKQAETDAA